MPYDLFIAFAAFAFVSSITPGPNNLMLMASGANFGIRRSVPHMLGISIGFGLMVVLVGAGLIQVFEAYPLSYSVLKAVSIAYLLYLAWRIANAAAPGEKAANGTPLGFFGAAAFQWVNPKAWAMALTAVSVYTPDKTLGSIVLVAVLFTIINLPSVGVWTVLGQKLRLVLKSPARLRQFNWLMAVLLVVSLWPVVFP